MATAHPEQQFRGSDAQAPNSPNSGFAGERRTATKSPTSPPASLGLFSGCRPGFPVMSTESVATRVQFQESPEAVWQRMLTYEEVPVRPPFLLRALLPYPVRTEGDKTCVGTTVRCIYKGGYLLKRILVVEPPHLLEFAVTQQCLGIEGCITAVAGSYTIRPSGDGTEIILTTSYQGHLRPRYFWRLLERLLIHLLHRHILSGMRGSLARSAPAAATILQSAMPKDSFREESPCTTSRSHSQR